MNIDLKRLRAANRERQEEWAGNEKADLEFRAIEVADEAGELAGAVKKVLRAQRGIAGTTMTLEDVAQEIGDTVISMDLLAAELEIELPPHECLFDETTLGQLVLSLDSAIGNLSYGVLCKLNGFADVHGDREPIEYIRRRLASAMNVVCSIAHALGIDAGQAVAEKFNQTSSKYGLQTRLAA